MSIKKRNELDRYYKNTEDIRTICKCGNRVKLPVMKSYIICDWCGKRIENKSKARFKYMLRRKLNEDTRNEIRDRKEK